MERKVYQECFKSITAFHKAIKEREVNQVFKNSVKSSRDTDYKFRGTYNYEEAEDMLKKGWPEGAKNIENKLKTKIKNVSNERTRKSVYDVVGGNCSVPRYLQGIPTNMVRQVTKVRKQKVVTINKNFSYNAMISKERIIEESVKALQIVREIESAGIRVNLNIIFMSYEADERIILKVRIKSANERLNVSKTAFALAHPSMLRRIVFRYIETHPKINEKGWPNGYGRPPRDAEIREYLDSKNEIYLPALDLNVEEIVKEYFNK